MTEDEQRRAIVTEARSWIGTPYHDCARVKGAGVDCAMLIAEVYGATDNEIIPVEAYSPQWYLHRSEEKFLGYVEERCREITEAEALAGDLVLFKFGRCFAHGAIVVYPGFPQIVHAFKTAKMVVLGDATLGELGERERRFFTRKTWGAD